MADAVIGYEKKGKIAIITLNRPETINAINSAIVHELNVAIEKLANDDDIWIGIINGAGPKGFSSGADLNSLEIDEATGLNKPLPPIKICHEMVTAKPIIAAVHGYCIGEGLHLVLACDMVFATADSKFFIPEARVGVNAIDIPLQLSRKIGYNYAFEFLMGLEPQSAEWCRHAGLINQIVGEDATAAALAWAEKLLDETAPLAIRGMKDVLWQTVHHNENEGIKAGLQWRETILRSNDWQEGLEAFGAKRKPDFQGN